MLSYTKEQIRASARRGHSITFLKSRHVAEAVGRKVEVKLRQQRVGGTQVEIGQDPRRPGAWKVSVMHATFHTPRGSSMAFANHEINTTEARRINQILDESYTPDDLLTSWSSSPQRR